MAKEKMTVAPAMQVRFEANQSYQVEAVAAVTDLFDGQPKNDNRMRFLDTGGFALIANRLDLGDEALLHNTRAVQARHGIAPGAALDAIAGAITDETGERAVRFPNFSLEMETGTGKTYVYIRTALELARHYGLLKFIIVVPSVAIREGVLKTFQMTAAHFRDLFSGLSYRFSIYDSGNLSRLRQFAEADSIEFLIMTIASFDRDANVIRKTDNDPMHGIAALRLLQEVRPILILDEPQNLKSEGRESALVSLDPLLALRYSATHPKDKLFNLVYRLTPFEAYRRRLVKRIEVAGVQQVGSDSPAFMRLEGVSTSKRTVTARLTLHTLNNNGTVKEKAFTLKPDGKSLDSVTHLPDYAPYMIDEISISDESVTFTNGHVVRIGETTGADKAAVFEAQIRYTIEEHFKKQRRLRPHGIKVLSLFFIDQVANYTDDDGVIRRLFRQSFDALKGGYPEWADADADAVQGAYFAVSKKGDSETDRAAYDLIMRDKETLLTFAADDDDPETRRKRGVCFLFSHSALREGWDNPNVFQICTLNQSVSEVRKRQEIGRGVRLSVDQSGARVHDDRLNVLTVIANQSYESYVTALQNEVAAEYGVEGAAPPPADAREPGVARLNPAIYELSDDFRALWDRIKGKTRYEVQIDTRRLLEDVVTALNSTPIAPPRVEVSRSRVTVGDEDRFDALATGISKTISTTGTVQQVNLVEMLLHMLRFTTPPIRITRATLVAVLRGLSAGRQREAMVNPGVFASTAARLIRSTLADQLVDGIQYHRIDDAYAMSQFSETIESWRAYLVPSALGLYDHTIVDSVIEQQFVQALEGKYRLVVSAYVKLPRWFVVPTPIGNYNPDWAIVARRDEDDPERVYFVSETKGTDMLDALRPDEARKVQCGRQHFKGALGVPFYVTLSVEDVLGKIAVGR